MESMGGRCLQGGRAPAAERVPAGTKEPGGTQAGRSENCREAPDTPDTKTAGLGHTPQVTLLLPRASLPTPPAMRGCSGCAPRPLPRTTSDPTASASRCRVKLPPAHRPFSPGDAGRSSAHTQEEPTRRFLEASLISPHWKQNAHCREKGASRTLLGGT